MSVRDEDRAPRFAGCYISLAMSLGSTRDSAELPLASVAAFSSNSDPSPLACQLNLENLRSSLPDLNCGRRLLLGEAGAAAAVPRSLTDRRDFPLSPDTVPSSVDRAGRPDPKFGRPDPKFGRPDPKRKDAADRADCSQAAMSTLVSSALLMKRSS